MPTNPAALSEFDTGLSPLILAHHSLDDPLILVVVVLELTRGMYFQVPIGALRQCCRRRGRPLSA